MNASLVLAWLAIAIGLAGAAGWIFDIEILKTGITNFADMKFNTAVCIILSGISVIYRTYRRNRHNSFFSSAAAASSFLIAAASLVEYIVEVDFGIDLLFFSDTSLPQFGLVPGRMSIITAAVLSLTNIAILMRNHLSKTATVWQVIGLFNLFLTFMVALSYIYGASSIAKIYPFTSLALPTTVALIFLNFSLLFSNPYVGIIAEFLLPYAGGKMARRLLPISIFILVVLGLLTRLGGQFGFFDRSADAVIIVTFGCGLLTWLILQKAGAQNKLEKDLLKQQSYLEKMYLELESKVIDRTKELELQKAALQRSERKYRDVIEGAFDSILVVDAEGKIILVNEQLVQKFGYTKAELIGAPVEILIPERHRSRHVANRKSFGLDPASRVMGARLDLFGKKKDGSEFPVDISLSPNHAQDGLRVTAIIRDITERKRHEDQQAFLAQIAKSLNEVLTYEDRSQLLAKAMIEKFADNCVIRVFEDGVLRAKGIATRDSSKLEILRKEMAAGAGINGRYGALEVAQSRKTVLVENLEKSLLENQQVDPKLREIANVMQVSSYVSAPMIAMGKVIGTLSVAMSGSGRKFSSEDITFLEIVANRSAVAIENALLNRQAQVAELVADNIPSMISYWDKNQVCRFANRAFFEWLGYSSEELPGQTLRQIIGNSMYEMSRPFIEGALSGKAQFFERDVTKQGTGELRHTQITYIPEIVGGKVQGFFVLVTDVTELKRVQLLALSEKDRAEAAVKLREEVLGIVSHDLRNPLGVINMAAYLLTQLEPPNVFVTQQATRIQNSAKAMQSLISDLLDFGNIEGGALKVDRVPVDVFSVVNEATDAMHARAAAKNIKLAVKISQGCPNILADKSRVIQVIWNLVGNAIKFTPEGGKVEISVSREEDVVRFSVTDTGPGISQENISKVFGRFWQARATASLGSGLGLAIAKGIVEAHSGKIWVQSTPGSGAQFNFTIPVSKNQEQHESQGSVLEGVRLLIVDDAADNLLLLRLLLEKAGAVVAEAQSVNEALAMIAREKPDVMITDIEMPNGSGYDLIDKVHSKYNNGEHIPVAALSAHSSKKELEKMAAAGFDLCLSKPVSQKKLLDSISELAHKRHH